MQSAGPKPPSHRATAEPHTGELRPGDYSVLPCRERCEPAVDGGWARICIYAMRIGAHPPILPAFA